jgi:type I restriction enzyme, R subunit
VAAGARPGGPILVVTDRDELDKQIEGVMKNAGVIGPESPSPRITSRAEFVEKLGAFTPRLLCALSTSSTRLTLTARPHPCSAASTCSWTSATARKAAT